MHYQHTYKTIGHLYLCLPPRYARSVGLAESVSARKFLEAAMGSGSDQVFYSTFTFFSLRNTQLRGNAAFAKGGWGKAVFVLLSMLLFLVVVCMLRRQKHNSSGSNKI